MNTKREEKALFEFKQIMEDLLYLLGRSTGATNGYLYWVNRSRRQFVLETTYKTAANVMFQDRIDFDQFFLDRFKNIEEIGQVRVGRDIQPAELQHFYDEVPVHDLLLIPFRNNGETVAITVLETGQKLSLKEYDRVIASYRNAHRNVLNTYLELTDLYEEENRWIDYDASVDRVARDLEPHEIIEKATEEMQALLPTGGATVVVRGMDVWVNTLRSLRSPEFPLPGLMVEEKTMAHDALQKGETLFSMHFNQNPKRISSAESNTEGATLAIPVMMNGRRQAVFLAFDKTPLVFTESVKHQLNNLARVAALNIQSKMRKEELKKDLFATEYGSFRTEFWELCLAKQLRRNRELRENVWFGMIGIENLSEIRSRFRLEELKKIQRMLVKALNPSRLGFQGLIGFHSDYVYSYLLYGADESHHQEWLTANIRDVKNRLDLGDGRNPGIHIKAGSRLLSPEEADVRSVVKEAKYALDRALRMKNETIVTF